MYEVEEPSISRIPRLVLEGLSRTQLVGRIWPRVLIVPAARTLGWEDQEGLVQG